MRTIKKIDIYNIIVIICLIAANNFYFGFYTLEKLEVDNSNSKFYSSYAQEYNSKQVLSINGTILNYSNPVNIKFYPNDSIFIKCSFFFIREPQILYPEYIVFGEKKKIRINYFDRVELIENRFKYILHVKTLLFTRDYNVTKQFI